MTSTTHPLCPHCGQPCPDGAYFCPRLATRLRTGLLWLASLAGDVDDQVAKLDRSGPATAGAPAAKERPLPVNLDAAETAWVAASAVTSWVSDVAERRGVPFPYAAAAPPRQAGPLCVQAGRAAGCGHPSCEQMVADVNRAASPAHPVRRLALWLLDHVEWLRHQPDGVDAVDELGDAVRQVEQAVDRQRDRWYAGPCGEPAFTEVGGGGVCDGELYAVSGARSARCPKCGTVVDAHARRDWLLGEVAEVTLAAPGRLALAAAAVTRSPVTPARVRGLIHRGTLRAVNYVDRDLTYRVSDLVTLIEQRRPEVLDVKPRISPEQDAPRPKVRSSGGDLTNA